MLKRKIFLFLVIAIIDVLYVKQVCAQDLLNQNTQGYEPPAIQQEGGWTLVLIPDPQAYTRYSRNQGIYDLITTWIAENTKKLDVKVAVCVGDMVESNNLQQADGKYANQTSKEMWECSSKAFERLYGVCPSVVCTGNHDYGPYIYPDGEHYGTRSSMNRETQFNTYFPINANPSNFGVLFETFENTYGVKTLENAAYQIIANNGKRVVIVVVEFAPRDETLAWAKSIFERPENADAFGILVTHSYMRPYTSNCKRDMEEHYELNKVGGNAGQTIWEKLVYSTANIRMILCGHHSTADNMDGCTGFRVDTNEAGKNVAQILCDMQAMGGGWEGNGGDGWIQLLEFSKDMKLVKVRTFSPLFAISPSTQKNAWYHAERQEFEFSIE